MKRILKKFPLWQVGMLQAIGTTLYILLISTVLMLLERAVAKPPQILGMILVLSLLVFSAAVTGLIFFGYAAHLALQKKIKDALKVLAYTLLSSLGMILIILIITLIVK